MRHSILALVMFFLSSSVFAQQALDQVVYPSKFWDNGSNISVYFYNGNDELNTEVIKYASEWSKFANIRFFETSDPRSQIRIKFNNNNIHNSYVGTDSLNIPHSVSTMNLGLNLNSNPTAFRSVVLHEFGHVLGLTHEQFYDGAKIPWDRAAVIRYYSSPLIGWELDRINRNILKPSGTNFGAYDKKSIMHYPVPNFLTIGDFEIKGNNVLSKNDKIAAAQIYPKPEAKIFIGTTLVKRPFNYKNFGDYTTNQFSTGDNIRGWSWSSGVATYIYTRGGKSFLVNRSYDGSDFGDVKQSQFSTGDNIRGWSWDREAKKASYVAFGDGKSTLILRPYNGSEFGPVESERVFTTGDNIRGWSWDGKTASYIVSESKGGKTVLITRPFDGQTFGDYQSIQFSSADVIRGWSIFEGVSSYMVSK